MLVRTEKLFKVYGKNSTASVMAVRNLDLTIAERDFVAVIGPSGSGKTTLLNLIAGITTPTTGNIYFRDERIDRLSANRRAEYRLKHLGFIFQDYQLLPMLTAFENVELPLQLEAKLSVKEIHERCETVLIKTGIAELGHRYPSELSGGQQQRVAIARAIANRPSLVLADEPTANLDSKTAQEIIQLFKQLNETENTTFIFSTHDQRLIHEVRTVLHMQDGELAR